MSLFDPLQNTLFDTVTNTMGYDAQWLPSLAGDFDPADFDPADFQTNSSFTFLAKVLYNGPTERERLLSANFDPDKLTIEYKAGDFPGLFELVEGGSFEPINITDIGYFFIRSISKKYDGKTFVATLAKP